MRRWRCVGLGLLVVAVCGCDGTTTPYSTQLFSDPPMGWGPAASPIFPSDTVAGGIVGAWLMCNNANCTSVDNDGILFRSDGTWVNIAAEDSTTYCEETISGHSGTYTWDGVILTMNGQSWAVMISGTIAWIVEDEVSIPMIMFAAHSAGPCTEQIPQP
jgi:hypothetical protein